MVCTVLQFIELTYVRRYVVEDNLGYVGGFGDLVIARESLLASFPELTRAIAPVDPTKFYYDMAAACQKLAKGNKVVLLHYPKVACLILNCSNINTS